MNKTKKDILVLAICQGLLLTNNAILIALSGLVGYMLSADKSLATLPVTTFVVGVALATIPASLLMKHIGRRFGFMIGAVITIIGSGICSYAIYIASFELFCAGSLVIGIANGFGQYYRFAAADIAQEDFKAKAISFVLAGGILGGIIGPESSKLTKDLFTVTYLGPYISLIFFGLCTLLLTSILNIPLLSASERKESGRPLFEILRQPKLIIAILSAIISYGVMSFLMTATPLAMKLHNHHYNDTIFVIEWHIIGMFLPSFFTGTLIKRFGVLQIMLIGVALMLICIGVATFETTLLYFWLALVLLGVGWNFLFIGATTLLTECYSNSEKAKIQGINDFLISCTMAFSSLFSGFLIHQESWQTLNYWSIPSLLMAGTAIIGMLSISKQKT